MAQKITKSVATLLADANASIRTLSIDDARVLHDRDDVTFQDMGLNPVAHIDPPKD